MGRLTGKVCLITGGGSGIGGAASRLFAREGAKVVIADIGVHGEDNVRQLLQDIKGEGGQAVFVKTDVSKVVDAQKMIATAMDTYGTLNVLFNNAGIQGPYSDDVADLNVENADRLWEVNFRGVFLGTKYAIPEMLKAGGGSIIHTGSICAFSGLRGVSVYNATKGAVVAFSHTVATEYGRRNIRSNTVNPSPARTTLHYKSIAADPEGWRQAAETIPLGRLAEPEDVAYAALFFASDESRFITGADLMVDGGWRIRGYKSGD